MCIISIDAVQGSEELGAAFNPQNQTVSAGDVIYWRNNTPDQHQPAPIINGNISPSAWMDTPIPGKLPDEPPPTSQQGVSFSGATKVNYACALHPNEKGTLTVQ